MSTKEVKKEQLEEKAVVKEVETKELVPTIEESKKAKIIRVGKKIGKIFGIAAFGGLCFALGKKTKSSSEPEYYENDSEVVEGEIVDSQAE